MPVPRRKVAALSAASAASLLLHAALVWAALHQRSAPTKVHAPVVDEAPLPVSMVGEPGEESAVQATSSTPPVASATPGEGTSKPSRPGTKNSSSGAAETSGADGVPMMSAVPRALIKAVVLMASHDGSWRTCAVGRGLSGGVMVRTDQDGHVAELSAHATSEPMQSTLRKAGDFLRARSFEPANATLRFRASASCTRSAVTEFEIGDTASLAAARGHVRYEDGARVDFLLLPER